MRTPARWFWTVFASIGWLACGGANRPGVRSVVIHADGKIEVVEDEMKVRRIAGSDDIQIPDAYRAEYVARYHDSGRVGLGKVALEYCVAEDGTVSSVKMLQPKEAPADFSAHYERALRTWRFEPYLQEGKAKPFCAKLFLGYIMS